MKRKASGVSWARKLGLLLAAAGIVLAPAAMAASLTALHTFGFVVGGPQGVSLGIDGNLYGTSCGPYCGYGGGVFKLSLPLK